MTQAAYTFHEFMEFAEKYQTEHGKPPAADLTVASLGGSKPTAIKHRQRWLAERAEPFVELPETITQAVSAAIYAAEARRDETHRQRDTVRDADLASLGEALDTASVRLDQLTADLATRTTERDQLIERATSLAAERDRLMGDLDTAKFSAGRAEALLHERTVERDRLQGQMEELRTQLAAAAGDRDQALGRVAALAAFAPAPQQAEQRAVPVVHKRHRTIASPT